MSEQVFAIGGGGFSMGDNLALDRHLLDLTGVERPRVCFIPTASADSDEYTLRFYTAMARLRADPTHLFLFRRSIADLRAFILECDAVYVGGGNTVNMLAVWQAHGLDDVLRDAVKEGIVLGGISAGAICWFESFTTDSLGQGISSSRGLGMIAGSCTPHYDGEPERRPAVRRALELGTLNPGIALDDGAAAHIVDGVIHDVVSSDDQSFAWRVGVRNDEVCEEQLAARVLDRS